MEKPTKPSKNPVNRRALMRLGAFAALLAVAAILMLPCAAWAAGADLAAGSLDNGAAADDQASVGSSGITTQRYREDYVDIPSSYITVEVGDIVKVTIDEDNDYVQWLAFTPDTSGTYIFEAMNSSDDPYGALYGDNEDEDYDEDLELLRTNDDGGNDYCFKLLSPPLEAGKTYYLACSEYSNDDCSYSVSITAYDPNDLACASAYYKSEFLSGSAVSVDKLDIDMEVPVWDEEEYDYNYISLAYNTDYKLEGWYSASYDADGIPTFTRLSSAPSNKGEYAAKFVGSGSYHGERYATFTIVDVYDLENGYWSTSVNNVYSASAVSLKSLEFKVYRNDDSGKEITLKLDTDYKLDGWYEEVEKTVTDEDGYTYTTYDWEKLSSAPKNPGYYKVVVKGAGKYYGTLSNTFNIYDPKDIGDYRLYSKSSLWSNGKAVTLSRLGVVIYRIGDSKTRLTADKHYKVKAWYEYVYDDYDDDYVYRMLSSAPKAPGEYEVVIEGISPYKGERSFEFYIKDASNIENYNVSYNDYLPDTGKAAAIKDLDLKVYRTDESGKEISLNYGTDYTIGDFERREYYYDEEYDEYDYTYVSLDGISDVCEPGYYRANVIGKGSYSGSYDISFSVVDSKDLNYATATGIDGEYYVGDKVPTPTVVAPGGTKLTKGKHYTVKLQRAIYDEDDDIEEYVDVNETTFKSSGDYCLYIQAVEGSGYSGYFRHWVYVYKTGVADISDSYYIDGIPSSVACTGKELKPEIVVRSKSWYDETLVKGEDYTVSYSSNVFSGKATITVKGKNYYKGTITATFTINKPAKGVKLTVGKAVYKVTKVGKEVAFVSTTATGKVSIPATVKIGDTTYKVTSIDAKAFNGNKKVKSVAIGANVAKVGANAFKGAAKCKTVTIATPKLKKASIKNILKGSKVKTLKLTGKAKSKKKAYQKFAGKKVKVK